MGESDPPLLPGLELLRPIGRGSFGEVWLARTVTGQYRAVKLVPLGAEGSGLQALGERVFRGVQAYLDHLPPGSPAALAVLHVDRDPAGRFLYYVMELADDVAGGRTFAPEHYQALTLSEFRRRSPEQCVPAIETIRLGLKLAEGLAALHAAGLVHRDIKPNNVVFIGGEPRLADIDLVRPAEASLSLGGAHGYSPLEGPGRPAADVFSLGRTLYATVTGLPVGEFPRLPEDWDQRPDAADLQRLNAVLLRACDPDPAQRHRDGAELAEDFRHLEQGEDVERARTNRSRIRRIAAAATLLLASLALLGALLVPAYRQRREQAEFERYLSDVRKVAEPTPPGLPTSNASAYARLARNHSANGLDLGLLLRQSRVRNATRFPPISVLEHHVSRDITTQLFFSPDRRYLASLSGNSAHLYLIESGKRIGTWSGVSALVGFLLPENLLVGTRETECGSSTLVVLNSSSEASRASLCGDWIPAGVLPDGQSVLVFPKTNWNTQMGFWNPRSPAPLAMINWNGDNIVKNHPELSSPRGSNVFMPPSSMHLAESNGY